MDYVFLPNLKNQVTAEIQTPISNPNSKPEFQTLIFQTLISNPIFNFKFIANQGDVK